MTCYLHASHYHALPFVGHSVRDVNIYGTHHGTGRLGSGCALMELTGLRARWFDEKHCNFPKGVRTQEGSVSGSSGQGQMTRSEPVGEWQWREKSLFTRDNHLCEKHSSRMVSRNHKG